MRVPLPDGSVRELPDGSTGADLAADIGPGLARAALAIRVLDGKTEQRDGTAYDDGRIRDLSEPLTTGRRSRSSPPRRATATRSSCCATTSRTCSPRRCSSSIRAPRCSIGPPIADGFYYDFDFPHGVTINEGDFEKIEAQMRKHVKAAEPFVRSEATTAEAIDRYLREDQPYKVELIEDLVKNQGVKTVGIYTNGEFRDLCRGPHAPDTGRAKAFKLTSVAGAYWRGDANRQMLTRIYGTAFATKDELAAAPRAARAGPRARPPQARPRARAVRVLGDRDRLGVLAPERHRAVQHARRALARDGRDRAATPRSRPRSSTTRSCGRPRGTGTSTARTCS